LYSPIISYILPEAMKKHKENDLTQKAPQGQIVLVALYECGGDARPIDTEDIAVKASKMAPGLFAWRKYPEQINLELIRVVLSNCKKTQYGASVEGDGRSGWNLTASGLAWVRSEGLALLGRDHSRSRAERRAGSVDEARWQRERARVLETEAWRLWQSGERQIPLPAIRQVFRIDDYSVGRTMTMKINRLSEQFAEDDKLGQFIETIAAVLREGTAES
jgi:hypothetical protein